MKMTYFFNLRVLQLKNKARAFLRSSYSSSSTSSNTLHSTNSITTHTHTWAQFVPWLGDTPRRTCNIAVSTKESVSKLLQFIHINNLILMTCLMYTLKFCQLNGDVLHISSLIPINLHWLHMVSGQIVKLEQEERSPLPSPFLFLTPPHLSPPLIFPFLPSLRRRPLKSS